MTPWIETALAFASALAPLAQQELQLGDLLLAKREYRLAYDEYAKADAILGTAAPASLHLSMGKALYYAGDYAGALRFAGTGLLAAKALLQMEDWTHAAQVLDGLPPSADASKLRAFATLEQGDLEGAKARFAALHDDKVVALIASTDLHPYSPTVAGALSIIPGGGQLYTGHGGQAVASFILNGALLALTWDAHQKARQIPHYGDAPAVAWGAVFALFYSANVYNAVDLAQAGNAEALTSLRGHASSLGYRDLLDQ